MVRYGVPGGDGQSDSPHDLMLGEISTCASPYSDQKLVGVLERSSNAVGEDLDGDIQWSRPISCGTEEPGI